MNLYRVFVYWICDDPELGHGERSLDTIFEMEDDSMALKFGEAWADDRTKALTDVFYIKHLACVKIGRWFAGGFRQDGTPEAGGGCPPFFEWKYDWMAGFTFPVAISDEIRNIRFKVLST